MKMGGISLRLVGFMVMGLLAGCSSTHVQRVDVGRTIDLSGRWNDSDASKVSQEMITDCLNRPWLPRFEAKNERAPIVIVGSVANKSHEHINADVFTKNLERELINSGKVKFVASRDERLSVRDERMEQNQAGFTDPETIKKIGKELGADFMLIGSINSVKDEVKGQYVILYQTNLELIDLLTNEKVWIGQEPLKKVVKKSKFSL